MSIRRVAMLPGGFKKDSRVWLHKNAHVYQKKPPTTDFYNNVQLNDDAYDHMGEDPFLNPSPYITDERGQVFKKDSRTWLHKSSYKKMGKALTTEVKRVSSTAAKTMNKMRYSRVNSNLSGGELGTDLVGTRSSTEMICKQNVLKLMKSKMSGLTINTNFVQTLDSVGELGTNTHIKKPGASYHSMKTPQTGGCEVSAYASDFCIVGKKNPAIKITMGSSSSSDNDVDEFGRRNIACSNTGLQVPGPDESELVGYNSSNMEVTKDGLLELERMMNEQSRNRSERLTVSRADDSVYGPQHDVSPDTASSGSKVSLDACINLSDELGNESSQVQNSTDQLSQSFEQMHLCAPKEAPADNNSPAGDS